MRKGWKIAVVFSLLMMVALAGCSGGATPSASAPTAKPVQVSETTSKLAINPDNPVAKFETSQGTFRLELFEDKAPITVKNFVTLASKNYYDGLIFHRIIEDFMIQGGDPSGNGTGGPGYKIQDEFQPALTHDGVGVLSMANAGPNTGGSQYFITLKATPWLDGKHAVFGRVIEGLDVVKKIGKVKTGVNDKPVENVVVNKLTIESKEAITKATKESK